MPFICEEIYSFLPNKKDMLINETYPEINFDNEYSEEIFELDNLIDVITQIRNRRNELNIHPSKRSTLLIDTSDIYYNLFKNNLGILTSMSNVDSIERVKNDPGDSIQIVNENYKIYIPLKGLVDYDKELERLYKEKNIAESELKRAEGKLNNKGFTSKAPQNLIDEEKEKIEKYNKLINEIDASIKNVKSKL